MSWTQLRILQLYETCVLVHGEEIDNQNARNAFERETIFEFWKVFIFRFPILEIWLKKMFQSFTFSPCFRHIFCMFVIYTDRKLLTSEDLYIYIFFKDLRETKKDMNTIESWERIERFLEKVLNENSSQSARYVRF